MKAELVPIGKVIPNPGNPRVVKDERYRKLLKSIDEFPDMLNKRPLVVVSSGDKLMVLGGNVRLKACMELGMDNVPVIHADDWTEEQRKEFVVKDNVSFGDWDWEELENNWDEEKLEEWGIKLPSALLDDETTDMAFEDASLQVRPGMEYVLIMAQPNSEEWEEMKQALQLKMVRRGGYKTGSPFDSLGLERVVTFDDMKQRMSEYANRDTK